MSLASSHSRRVFASLALAASISAAGEAYAQPPTKAVCTAAYVDGQKLLRSGALKKARDLLLLCARDPCPAAFQPECLGWLSELDHRMPTVLFEAQTKDGSDVADAAVFMDGVLLQNRIDGRAVAIDPGEHKFRFEKSGLPPVEKTLVVREGEQSRRLRVTLDVPGAPSPASPAPVVESSRPITWPVWTLGGVGAVALVSFTGFAVAGLVQHNTLNACKGSCSPSEVSSDRTKLQVADVSLGISVAALGAATILFFLRPAAGPTTAVTAEIAPMVGPTGGGGRFLVRF